MSGRTAPTYGEVVAGFMFLADDLRRVSEDVDGRAWAVEDGAGLSMEDVHALEDSAADLHHRASELRVRAARCGMRGVA